MSGFGEMLRAQRKARGLTQAQLAARAGCNKSYLSAIERGERGPPADDLVTRLEASLALETGVLARVGAAQRLDEILRSSGLRVGGRGGLDGAHASGELRRLIDKIAPDHDGTQGSSGSDISPMSLPRGVPLINKVSAGYPRGFTDLGFPARVADEYVSCPDLDDPDAFAARVFGDSMDPVYREGDVVVFSPAHPIVSGDDCFARLEPDHESTFKRVYFEHDEAGAELIRLQPLNERYSPRTLPREEVAGLCRAVMVMRSL